MSGLPFVNIKKIVLVHLRGLTVPARRDRPVPIESALPFVQVLRAPGSESQHTAMTRIDLHNFAATEDAMWDLTKASHEAMHRLSGRVIDGHRIDNVETVQDPSDLPWSASVFRSVAVYEIPVRPA